MNDSNSHQQSAPHTGAWWMFAAFGLLFLIYGIYAFTLPYLQPTHWDDIASSNETVTYIADNFRWIGMLAAIGGVLTIAIAYGGFRRAQRWAWYSLLSYPVFFLLAVPFTWPGFMWSPFLVASIATLWATYRSVFQRA